MFGIDDMAIAGGMSALANLGGGIIGANSAQGINAQMIASQQSANYANMTFSRDSLENSNAQANINRELQWKMANTAYQRATADMRAAGLNPILAYQQGGAGIGQGSVGPGAPSPSQQGVSGLQNPGDQLGKGIANAVSSAVDAAKTVAGVKLMKEQEETQRKTQKLQEDQAKAAVAAAMRDEAAAVASAAQARKTEEETRQIVPAQAANYLAGAGAHSASATYHGKQSDFIGLQIDKFKNYGQSTAADLADTTEKITRRTRDTAATQGPWPSDRRPSPFEVPFTGLRNDFRARPR